MAVSYKCAYCGSMQTWSGTGPRVCQFCGATQPEKPGSTSPGSITTEPATKPGRRGVRLVVGLVGALVVLFTALLLLLRRPANPTSTELPSVVLRSRMLAVNNPSVRTLPAGSDLSAIDLVHSAPDYAANLFDTKLLTVTSPRGMNDIEGKLWFVGEVVNHSADRTAVAPSVQMGIVKNGRVVETSDLNFDDLPPGGHSPAYFTWDGEPRDVQNFVFRWKPVVGYIAATANHPRLETTITNRKLTPGSVTVNFAYTYHFMSAEVQGTVTNRGNAAAQGVHLYLTLRDAKGRVTGFKEKDLDPLAPGEQVQYDVDADQWGDPVASMDVEALLTSQTKS